MAKERIRPSQFAHADLIAQNDNAELSQEQIKSMEELFENESSKYRAGQLVTGKVLSVDSDGVLVDINYKSNGMIPLYEFSERELKGINAGSDLEVIIDDLENVYGDVVLSYENAKAMRAWDRITKLFEDGEPVEGVVTHKVKGGLSVDVGVPAFLPGSQVDLYRVTDFDTFVGQTITADIIKLNKKRGNIIISRRKHLSERRDESRKQVLDTLEVDKVIQGVVKNITNYGVFIDVGGVDGLLHITDMTWGRISHPSELVKISDTVTVKVLSIDKDNNKISLGMKQLGDNPWQELDKNVQVGSIITGNIASIADYGLFVEVRKGVEGLVHISEISWTDRISDLKDRYQVGQEVEVLVVSLDVENRRMSLSIKQLNKDPWSKIKEEYKEGDKIKGKITNIADFGIFVQIIPGVDGLVHVSDLSWTEHVAHPSDLYKVGDEVEASILSINEENKKIALSVKHLTKDPWENIEKEYPAGSIVKAEVTKVGSHGAFVKLPNKIEGLIYKSDVDSYDGDAVEIGQTRELRVVNVNTAERKIGLSLKLEEDKKSEEKPKRKAPKREAKSDKKAEPVMKSALQIELEKHAAKQEADKKKNK
ncbi:MAG: 30S ribosomal protein S1 [Epsilonproteobacteria bacterium]|nr:30S ribosomal protein S1 [Campylobacterota bacterium]|tara:strand:- start:2262 stop:4043 length:1782 start_codon:yes stop_codon:yes gene_type:complete